MQNVFYIVFFLRANPCFVAHDCLMKGDVKVSFGSLQLNPPANKGIDPKHIERY